LRLRNTLPWRVGEAEALYPGSDGSGGAPGNHGEDACAEGSRPFGGLGGLGGGAWGGGGGTIKIFAPSPAAELSTINAGRVCLGDLATDGLCRP